MYKGALYPDSSFVSDLDSKVERLCKEAESGQYLDNCDAIARKLERHARSIRRAIAKHQEAQMLLANNPTLAMIERLPITVRVRNLLAVACQDKPIDLLSMTDDEIAQIDGLGPKAVRDIRAALSFLPQKS
jgi:DNA-directed RNA polymerase alpha subunit